MKRLINSFYPRSLISYKVRIVFYIQSGGYMQSKSIVQSSFKALFNLLIATHCLISPLIADLNPIYLKDTYDLLNEELRYLSPVHGAVWRKSRLLKNFYDYATADATGQLTHELFHEVPGNFTFVNNDSYPASHFSAATIGRILGILHLHHDSADLENHLTVMLAHDQQFQLSLQKTQHLYKQLTDEIKTLKTTIKGTNPDQSEDALAKAAKFIRWQIKDMAHIVIINRSDDEIIRDLTQAITQAYNDANDKKVEQLTGLHKNFTAALTTLNDIQKRNQGLRDRITMLEKKAADHHSKKIQWRLEQLIKLIVASHHECIETKDKTARFVPCTTHNILLAFLYAKADSKQELRDYFLALNEVIDSSIMNKPNTTYFMSDSWLEATYTNNDVTRINQEIATAIQSHQKRPLLNRMKATALSFGLICSKKFENDRYREKILDLGDTLSCDNAACYADIVYAEIINQNATSQIPKISGHSSYSTFNSMRFPDCVETALRMLSNIALFNVDDQSFTTKKLTQQGCTPTADVRAFYEYFSSALAPDETAMHNDWNDLVSNLPRVSYLRMASHTTNPSKQSNHPPAGCSGFIYGIDAQRYGAQRRTINFGYVKNEHDVYLPYAEEFSIITINGKDYCIVDPTHYFLYELAPTLSNAIIVLNNLLGLNLYSAEQEEELLSKTTFNTTYFPQLCTKLGWQPAASITKEYLNKTDFLNIPLTLTHSSELFTLHLNPGHGYVSTPHNQTKKILAHWPGMADYFAHKALQECSTKSFFHHKSMQQEKLTRHINLLALLMMQLNPKMPVDQLEERHQSIPKKWRAMYYFASDPHEFENFYGLIEQGHALEHGKAFATTKMTSSWYVDKMQGLEILNALVKNNYAIEEAIQVKREYHYLLIVPSLKLLTSLIEKDYAFEEAKKQIVKFDKDNVNDNEACKILNNLVIMLISKQQAIPEIIAMAQRMFTAGEDLYYRIMMNSFKIFEALIKNGYALDEAVKPAAEARTNCISTIRQEGRKLTALLIKARLQKKFSDLLQGSFLEKMETNLKNYWKAVQNKLHEKIQKI